MRTKAFLGLVLIAGCTSGADTATSTTTQDVATTNGIFQNGLTTNGIFQNGIFQNGIFQNGIFQNGIFQNGIFQNGIWTSGLWANSTWQNDSNGEALKSSVYARQFVEYVYACAFPPGMDASIDPNGGTLACGPADSCDT